MKTLKEGTFTKISGTGNTFVFFSELDGEKKFSTQRRKELAKEICQSQYDIKSDGIIFLDQSENYDFVWDFYNADGSAAEMCGNATRCVGAYYYHKVNKKNKIIFETVSGIIETEFINLDDYILKSKMPIIMNKQSKYEVKLGNKTIRGFFINTGVPHFVIQNEPDLQLAKSLRSAKEFGPSGSNITFVELDETDYMNAVTFERGVEDFTLSCGTGAVAAAAFHKEIYKGHDKEIYIEMPGGVLSVELTEPNPYLIGQVEIQYDFNIYEEI